MVKGSRLRSWMFASFAEAISMNENKIRYAIWQQELDPETGRLRFHGYIEFDRARHMSTVKKMLGDDSIHLEPRRGTRTEARDSCSNKQICVAGPWEIGDFIATSTERPKLEQLFQDAISMDDKGLMNKYPGLAPIHAHGIAWARASQRVPRTWSMKVDILWGPDSAGMTRHCVEHWPSAYFKIHTEKWWDGYSGQETVVIDDFEPESLGHIDIVHLFGSFPMYVETRQGPVPFCSRRIVVTSSMHPEVWARRYWKKIQHLITSYQYFGGAKDE